MSRCRRDCRCRRRHVPRTAAGDSILSARDPAHGGEARGLALIALSTLAYGVQPIFGKVAYAAGVEPLPLLAWRYLIALVCLELLERGPRPPLRERLRLWGIGSVFVVNSVAYFMALEALPASVTALVLFTYPVIVALLAALAGVEALTWRSLLAALAAFAGCALTAGGLQLSAGLPARGVAWALAAAVVYAGYVVLSSRFGRGVQARVLALHLVQVAALLCVVMALAGPRPFAAARPAGLAERRGDRRRLDRRLDDRVPGRHGARRAEPRVGAGLARGARDPGARVPAARRAAHGAAVGRAPR